MKVLMVDVQKKVLNRLIDTGIYFAIFIKETQNLSMHT